jgi:hypothetical protein
VRLGLPLKSLKFLMKIFAIVSTRYDNKRLCDKIHVEVERSVKPLVLVNGPKALDGNFQRIYLKSVHHVKWGILGMMGRWSTHDLQDCLDA